MAEGFARDRFGHVHPAGPRFRLGACYNLRMAFGKKKSDDAKRARRTKPAPPPVPELEAAPELDEPDLEAPELKTAGARVWPPTHDEEW